MKYIVPQDTLLLEALAQLAPQSSKNTLRSWIKEGRVEINGVQAKTATLPVQQGEEVTVGQRKKQTLTGIPIIYEDEDLVIINKPSGLLSVATNFEKGETLLAQLRTHYRSRQVFVVHRLDQDTSGVMVFALNQECLQRLKVMFGEHAIERSYTAILEGQLEQDSGTWQSYQYEDAQYYVHETNAPEEGRLAITHYQLIHTSKRYSWVELQLETGRKNQIRVHCQAAGHSVVGDQKYGAMSNPLKRLGLHAHLLAFQHPISKKMLRFESPIPEPFYRLFPTLRQK